MIALYVQIERVNERIGEDCTSSASSRTAPWPDGSGLGLDGHRGLKDEMRNGIGVKDGIPYRRIWSRRNSIVFRVRTRSIKMVN